jgi:integrase
MAAVRAWLEARGGQPGPLFCRVRRGGHPTPGHRLTGEAVGLILARRAEAAGVARFGAHDLRRTAVGNLLDAGIDIATVSQICGHADPGTTARYDRRPEQAKQRAATVLQVPLSAPADGDGGPGGGEPQRESDAGDPSCGA